MSFSSIGTFFFHNNWLEDKVIDYISIGCMCNLPIKKIIIGKCKRGPLGALIKNPIKESFYEKRKK